MYPVTVGSKTWMTDFKIGSIELTGGTLDMYLLSGSKILFVLSRAGYIAAASYPSPHGQLPDATLSLSPLSTPSDQSGLKVPFSPYHEQADNISVNRNR